MRLRPLTALLALLLAVVLVYALWWQKAGKQAVSVLDGLVARARLAGVGIDYHGPYLSGFPLKVGVLVRDLHVSGPHGGLILTAQELEIAAPAWDALNPLLSLTAPSLTGDLGAGMATLSSPQARGKLGLDATGTPIHAELGLPHPRLTLAAAGGLVSADYRADSLQVKLDRPVPPPNDHLSAGLALNLDMVGLGVPQAPGLGGRIDHLGLNARLMGAVPLPVDAATLSAWSRDGGTVEIDRLSLRWGGMGVSANATLSLDRALQPLMAGSADVTGYEVLIDGMTAAGRLRPGDGDVAKMALGLMSRPGVGGESTMRLPLGLQNHKLTLGPLPLAQVPDIHW